MKEGGFDPMSSGGPIRYDPHWWIRPEINPGSQEWGCLLGLILGLHLEKRR